MAGNTYRFTKLFSLLGNNGDRKEICGDKQKRNKNRQTRNGDRKKNATNRQPHVRDAGLVIAEHQGCNGLRK